MILSEQSLLAACVAAIFQQRGHGPEVFVPILRQMGPILADAVMISRTAGPDAPPPARLIVFADDHYFGWDASLPWIDLRDGKTAARLYGRAAVSVAYDLVAIYRNTIGGKDAAEPQGPATPDGDG